MIPLKLSLVCYSVPLQDKLKIPPVQKPLLQLLAFGHHELRDASSSQKVRVEVHTGGSLTDNWINFSFGTFVEQEALSSAIGGFQKVSLSASPNKRLPRMILLKLSLVCYSVPLQDKLKILPVQKPLLQLLAFDHHELRDASSSQKVRDEVSRTGGFVTDNWINFLFDNLLRSWKPFYCLMDSDMDVSFSRRVLLLRCSSGTYFFYLTMLAHLSVAIDRISCI
ncbi:uncharacterized protein [Solanum lycopersicum]|uniref:uncharacterized protein isoform X2 n=1 Tax=Solanum lycopersicum TaxID=4081 RepID=UPI000E1CFB3A|nr:uncharacterized protein LOC104645291 isoform X1 [Solanum lycopersicum]XP_025883629.1 uncharacterized protein LOC104645291 isoform X1 [Solanum lycopersicum]XP_025883633.1 uncharacterized protein LOC104645291 isoform X1 [Solanum lycopersicum]XP_025883634.1 uncharacterized protein LOC104645291 isoform X1 [Solanum lycopersicum]XP_025883635.1 uncharacterized protein LOC104645291 isoform X1 [Solanum lycopersicum]XP_025883637.1 uncharacterized protein LOC104645291 isoform X1 [Solanum lycopersicum]